MKIQLVDLNQPLVDEWNKQFKDCIDVTTHCDSIFNVPTDCYVSPANSAGFLDGGIDDKIRKFYDKRYVYFQDAVHNAIIKDYDGELLVGQAIYFPIFTFDDRLPDLIVAPTMRVPMKLPQDSVNIYLAMRGILLKLKSLQPIGSRVVNSISISGLGTGIGKVPYDICAKQMKQAYDDFWLGKYKFPCTWKDAQNKHQLLYSDAIRDIQYEELDEDIKKIYGLK